MIVTQIITVTPEMAKEWLEKHNNQNRSLNIERAKVYRDIILSNNWVVTHQGIAFSDDGNLIDGQHRLKGIDLSGIAVEVMVTKGLQFCDTKAIDNGRVRSMQDQLRIAGYYEMLQIKAEAESVIKDIPLEDFVPKQTACLLRKHNIPDLMTLFWQEEEYLKALKGISEKRYQHVCEGLKALAKKHPSFRELAWDSHRGDMCREFILADAANSEKIYQHYLESKKK